MNQIIEVYRDHFVHQYNKLQIRVSQSEYKKFIDAKLDLGLSTREVLEFSGRPCDCCRDTEVLVFNKKDSPVKIKRGILHNKRK